MRLLRIIRRRVEGEKAKQPRGISPRELLNQRISARVRGGH